MTDSIPCLIAACRATESAFLRKLCSETEPRLSVTAEVSTTGELETALSSVDPAVTIIDLDLISSQTGEELLRRIQAAPSTPAVLVVAEQPNAELLNRMMLLGVRSVLPRPVSPNHLKQVVAQLFRHAERIANVPVAGSTANRMRTFIARDLVSLLITGAADKERIDCYFRFLGVQVSGAYFLLVSRGRRPTTVHQDNGHRAIGAMDLAEQFLSERKDCLVGNSYGSKIIALFPVQGQVSPDRIAHDGLAIAKRLQLRIKQAGGLTVPIGVGSLVSDIARLNEAYNEAFYALYLAERDNSVVHYSWLWSYNLQQKEAEYPHELENTFLTELRQGNTALLYELTDEIISYIVTHCERIGTMKEWVAEFVTILKRETAVTGLQINLCHHGGKLMELNSLQTVEELRIWCRKAVLSIIDNINQDILHDSRDPLGRVFTIIDKPFDRAITLESTAAKIGLSPQYLSRVFKERYKTKFIDYLTHRRISYARELLKDRRLTMREIAERVGYGDANYFTRVFRKQTGVSPRQYRDRQ